MTFKNEKVPMDYMFMVKIDIRFDNKLIDSTFHGAFKSFRSASKWLINEGFEPFFNDNLSELYEEETVSFMFIDNANNEDRFANIEAFAIQD